MRERIVIWIVAIVALAPFYALALPDESVFPYYAWSDYTSLQLPVHEFIRDELLSGRVPLWIPWVGNGSPLHASQQAGVFYPGLTLPLLLFPANYALKVALLLHLAIAYAGEYRLCRALGTSPMAASFAALVTVQSGFLVNHMMAGHVNIITGAALVPWFLWALVRLLDSPGGSRAAVIAGIGGAFALGSQPQISYYALLFGAAWVVGWLLFASRSVKRLRAIAWLTVAAIGAILIGAVQLVPAIELFLDGRSESPRGTEAYAATYSLDGLDVARLVVPDLIGNPFLNLPQLSPHDSYHERVGYLGLGAWALAAYGLTRATAVRWQWGAAALVLCGLAIALGNSTPSFSLLGRLVPGLLWFRCPARDFALVTPLVALSGARGFDAILRGDARVSVGRLWPTIAVMVAAGCLIVPVLAGGRTLSWHAVFNHAWLTCRSEIIASAVFAANTAAAMLLAARHGRGSPLLSMLALLAVAFSDLTYHNATNVWFEPREPQEIPADLLAIDPPIRFVDAPHYPDIAAQPLYYSRMVEMAVRNRRSMVGMSEGGIIPGALARYYRSVERHPRKALAVGACNYLTHRGGRWIRLHGALPRIRFTTGRAEMPIEKLSFEDLSETEREPPSAAESPSRNQLDDMAAEGESSIVVLHEESHRLALRLNAADAGTLIVADTWYPGWQCEVDGAAVAIDRAYGVFRAVQLPAGKHEVTFGYLPISFRSGVSGTLAGLALVAVLLVLPRSGRLGKASLCSTVSR